jgi:ElaB/YqjD/DUF883 family membrane-anchored ribosome-binding protein
MASTTQFGASGASEAQHQQGQARDPRTELSTGAAPSLQEVGAHAREVAREVRQMADVQTEALMAWIRERPMTSVLIGAAVGYVLGRIAGR